MKDNEERYCNHIVDMIMKYDVRLGVKLNDHSRIKKRYIEEYGAHME